MTIEAMKLMIYQLIETFAEGGFGMFYVRVFLE